MLPLVPGPHGDAGSLKPLLSQPARTDYPILLNKKVIGERFGYSISPYCGCFSMQETSINCCCANSCAPFNSITYGNALHYAGVGSAYRTLSSLGNNYQFDNNQAGGQALNLLKQAQAVEAGQRARKDLEGALGLRPDDGAEGVLARCCCFPCVQCQEIDTVMVFYRDSLGYSDIKYGSCWSCQCCRFYATLPPGTRNPVGGFGKVPMPESIYRGETIGPNYPPTDLANGYKFVDGRPVLKAKELEKPEQEARGLLPRGGVTVK